MSPATRIEARILASAAFRRARTRADSMLTSPQALRELLASVEAKQAMYPKLHEGAVALDIDIIASVIEAHCEAVSHPARGHNATSITAKARLTLVVAALTYLVEDDDLIPDHLPHGLTDDIALLRWASRMARAELPA